MLTLWIIKTESYYLVLITILDSDSLGCVSFWMQYFWMLILFKTCTGFGKNLRLVYKWICWKVWQLIV